MGLMLSVLVFFVGVVELLDCWHHFLLHLVQPKQVHHHYQSNTDLLTTRGLHTPVESRRSSHLDICWPKDISPTDDLHVIKKRSHSEGQRPFEHDENSPRRHSKEKLAHNEPGSSLPMSCSPPQIVVHCLDIDDPLDRDSPLSSRDSSPNYLELSVIVESDSSSEFDEPSQVENPDYKKRKEAESSSSSLEPAEEPDGDSEEIIITGDQEVSPLIVRLKDENVVFQSESPSQLGCENAYKPRTECLTETLSKGSDLPIFTDNIVSGNVMKISCQYAPDISNTKDVNPSYGVESSSCAINRINDLDFTNCILESNSNELELHSNLIDLVENEIGLNDSHSSAYEEIEIVPNFPKITLKESSPIPLHEDGSSDSSLNTSDASWMVKSKTSERPSMVRFSPEEIAEQFISVTKVDLKALGAAKSDREDQIQNIISSKSSDKPTPLEVQLEAERVVDDIIEKAISYISKETLGRSDILNGVSARIAGKEKYCESNSSSSSLSGIPQLPEDFKDSNNLNLPSNNGYGNHSSDGGSMETSYSVYDYSVQSSPFTDVEENKVQPGLISACDTEANGRVTTAVEKENIILPNTNSELRPLNRKVKNESITLESGDDCSTRNRSDKKKGETLQSMHGESSSKIIRKSSVKNKSRKKLKSLSSDSTSSESEDVVLLCRAKESDAEDCVVEKECVRSTPPPSTMPEPDTSSAPEPSTSERAAANPEDKAFWLIFSGEYTKAMDKDWHSGHFCCWQCDESLTGQRYVLRDDHPYCIKCYESVFANGCEECSKTIGIDSKDLSYKDKHWHEACFLCNKCRVSLVDKQFGSKLDKIFCGNCYDAQFASRCDGCGKIFKAGTKKMEYKTRQWHEPCFACCVCKSPIGTKSFIPREQEIYCATCYEEKFATRCVKCNKIITSGGVTYKNEPWHRECFTCTNCSTSLAGQRFTSKEEKPYCADCFGELFAKRCTACSKPITGIGGTRFVSFEDRHWHNDCFICASCKTSLVGRGFITDGDDIICPECAKQKLM